MEGISAAAAVIGLVQAGAHVTTLLGRYISSINEADSSCTRLLDQIKLISAAETTIESIIRNSSPSLRTPGLQTLIDEWFRENGTPRKCKRELKELANWLETKREATKQKKWAKMISWPSKEEKIRATIRAFEGYMPYFRDVLSIETFNLVESVATRHKNEDVTAAKMSLLSWLDGFDCTDRHEFTLGQRQQTTGEWLFKERLYLDWRDGSIDFLWLHGKAGAGKSVLASVIIDDISNQLANNQTLAYFYCDFRNSRSTSAMEVLRSIIKQLLWNAHSDWLSSFSDLTMRMQRCARPPTDLDTLSNLLKRAAGLHTCPVVLVDALDECEDLEKLLDHLTKLSRRHCRLFVTSRTLYPLKEAFAGLPSISLDDRVDEVRQDMYFHIRTELRSRSRLKTLSKELKDEIEAALMTKADGMFRWVQCQLDRLNDCWSIGHVREVLHTLPRTLYDTYERMIEAISRTEFGPRIARRALLWLALALDPLKLSQLTEALAIKSDEPTWDVSNAPMHGTDILEICGSLIAFDEKDGLVTLSHYSVKEYLTSDAAAKPYFVHRPLGCFEVSLVSIYSVMLYFHAPHDIPRCSDGFCFYALRSGFKHLASCPSDLNKVLVDNLLSLQDCVSTYHPEFAGNAWKGNAWMIEVPQLALYVVTRFGHWSMLQYYLNSYFVVATEHDNPMVYAALYGDPSRLQLFLNKGLNVNVEGPIYASWSVHKMSPLIAAVRNETPEFQEPLVKLLLEHGCTVPQYAVHLVLQCRVGALPKSAVIRILLDHGADPTLLAAGDKNSLHLLVQRKGSLSDDDIAIACMLVTAGCDPLALDGRGFSPFHHAISGGEIRWLQWLLQRGFQLPPDAILHLFPRQNSITGHTEVLRMMHLLLENDVHVSVRDANGCNAFHRLARLLFIDYELMAVAIRQLLDHGCDINSKNNLGETPLHLFAAHHAMLDGVKLFVAHGARLPIDIINYSVTNGALSFVDMDHYVTSSLIPLARIYGASCRSHTQGGDNPLHHMLKFESRVPRASSSVARFLLENGCDVRATNSWGATPLQLAIENGHLATAQLILSQLSVSPVESGPLIPHVVDTNANGILHRLCSKLSERRTTWAKFKERLTLLQGAGYDLAKDINRRNHKGFTPLCIVLGACNHDLSPAGDMTLITSLLLDLGAKFSEVTPLYMDNFEWATALPWYRNAAEAHRHSQSRFQPCFDDATQVYHFLQRGQLTKLPSSLSLLIMNIAEYWACSNVARKDIRYTSTCDGVTIAFPAAPCDAGCWIPRRILFSCKPRVVHSRGYSFSSLADTLDNLPIEDIESRLELDVRVKRPNGAGAFDVPVALKLEYVPPYAPRTVFDAWDEYTPAAELNGKGQLAIAELTDRDVFYVEFCHGFPSDDYFELEFFQIEVLYAVCPSQT